MAQPKTVFLTYMLSDEIFDNSGGYGYGNSIYCNYVQKFQSDDAEGLSYGMTFTNISEFKFMQSTNTSGIGFMATKIFLLIQVFDSVNGDEIPLPNQWKIIDVTSQVRNHTVGEPINPVNCIGCAFNVTQEEYDQADLFILNDYITYPFVAEENKLTFGNETYFFGNIKTDANAVIETMDIGAVLDANEFNTTDNESWDGNSDVYISEIGVYNEQDQLVGVGKINYPVIKNNTLTRTILFNVDF